VNQFLQAKHVGQASQQYEVLYIKKPVNEFIKTHLLAFLLGIMSQSHFVRDYFLTSFIVY
ncbi:hypothetical protein, partial [Staphylococcus borealis]|uniref:hypothetical protein n=1 Tax=Staphylococcus borealis TaxID=2742203 RepID=UPI001C93430A